MYLTKVTVKILKVRIVGNMIVKKLSYMRTSIFLNNQGCNSQAIAVWKISINGEYLKEERENLFYETWESWKKIEMVLSHNIQGHGGLRVNNFLEHKKLGGFLLIALFQKHSVQVKFNSFLK